MANVLVLHNGSGPDSIDEVEGHMADADKLAKKTKNPTNKKRNHEDVEAEPKSDMEELMTKKVDSELS